ncbi:MAG: sn-glycerol-1-phosphate dehydrogenase [Clostridia bacterium]|nr:sn-glycerol-1-phosphate dehydrogenase [Clostridia bacterium]
MESILTISEILETFRSPCACGKQHELVTDTVYIGENAAEKLSEYIRVRMKGQGLIIADTNTAPAAGNALSSALGLPILIIDGASHATEIVCAEVEEKLDAMNPRPDFYIACGSGSLHDITRYIAYGRGQQFISYPTAASVDGFVSGIAAMTIRGTKISYPSRSPVALFADPDVFSEAPVRLTASGVGDLLGKYICLADWRIANILTGEYICPTLVKLEYDVIDEVEKTVAALKVSGGDPSYKKEYAARVMEGLVLSGLAIQLCGNSRPASGAEHHISHFWEMERITGEVPGLHGEQVGIGTLLMLKRYKEAAKAPAKPFIYRPEKVFDRDHIASVYRELTDDIMKENLPGGNADSSSLAKIPENAPVEHAEEVRAVLDSLPDYDALLSIMKDCGCKTSPADIDLPETEEFIGTTCAFAPYVRNRLTLLKLLEASAL